MDRKKVEEEIRISHRTGKPIDKKKSAAGKNKRKRKSNNPDAWKSSPVIGMNGYNLEEGDNTKYIMLNQELYNMPDIDLDNVDEVQQRLDEYFAVFAKYDTKPTAAGMAMCLNGMSRRTLWAIVNDAPTGSTGYKSALPTVVTQSIKKAYFLLENLYENYMQNGKINPVAGIFLGKNNYGYQDKTEHVVTPNVACSEEYSTEDIRKRYITSDSTDSDDE